jgi:broad specificity phosphatase PhoE
LKNILLLRHGRTEWNDTHRFQGSSDIPLNEPGLVQAERTARRLASWPLDAVYTSPLIRARQTAAAIAAPHRKDLITLDGLTEIRFGKWETQFFDTVREKERERMEAWLTDPFFNIPEGAETWDVLRERVAGAVRVVLDSGHERVAVVSHGGIMRVLFVVLLRFDPHSVWNVRVDNCTLSGIEVREKQTTLAFSNDGFHLCCPPESAPPVW